MPELTDEAVAKIREQFPALGSYTYFTTNGLGVLSSRTLEALRDQLEDLSRNAIVSVLFRNEPLVSDTRTRVARFLNCQPEEIAFCRNTSEGVLWTASSLRFHPGDEVLLVQGEYPANILPWMAQECRGVVTRLLRPRDRRVTPELVAEAWSRRTRVLAISFVQYNSGFRADLGALAEIVHSRGGVLFCDAIQGLGAVRLDVQAAGIDFLSAGTHKWLLGLQGLGLFFCRRDQLPELEAIHVAASSLIREMDPEDPDAPYDREFVDEVRRFEEGTRNYLGIAALRQSLQLIEDLGIENIEARVRALTEYVVREVERRGCRVASPRGEGEWSGILLFAPPAGGPKANDIVAAMHGERITINAREGCIHMGVHFYNTHADIDRMLSVLDGQLR